MLKTRQLFAAPLCGTLMFPTLAMAGSVLIHADDTQERVFIQRAYIDEHGPHASLTVMDIDEFASKFQSNPLASLELPLQRCDLGPSDIFNPQDTAPDPVVDNPPVSSVPLPAAAWLFLSGIAGLSTLAVRRRG